MRNQIFELVEKTAIEILQENQISYNSNNIILYCSGGLFDSMDLVNFISILEEQIFLSFNKSIQLSHPSVFSGTKSPFKDLNSTTDFIISLL